MRTESLPSRGTHRDCPLGKTLQWRYTQDSVIRTTKITDNGYIFNIKSITCCHEAFILKIGKYACGFVQTNRAVTVLPCTNIFHSINCCKLIFIIKIF